MQSQINKYLDKLQSGGLANSDEAIFLSVDADLYCNKSLSGKVLECSRIFDLMNIQSLLFARPAEPYRSIIGELIKHDRDCHEKNVILPMDCETRTFFHDIPVIDDLSAAAIAEALSRRKAAIVRGEGIVTYGSFTPEQAYVSFSSTCFSTFVKYFYDALVYLYGHAGNNLPLDNQYLNRFSEILRMIEVADCAGRSASLISAPPVSDGDVSKMMCEAGRSVVEQRLVDSHFGNISHIHEGCIFISETGSSLDELEGCIDKVPLDGSSCAGITASSELSAHKNIYLLTGLDFILHGHPKFAVIMSMYCTKEGCDRTLCHKACKERRDVLGTPVVAGEIGTGFSGLMNTVPAAIKESGAAIVFGHGVFAAGKDSFQKPFDLLIGVEKTSKRAYIDKVRYLLEHLRDGYPDGFAEGA